MPARLTVHFPRRASRVVFLAETGEHRIGRDPECEVVVDDDRVSRRHACLRAAGERWTIADLGSKNGTAVDGVALSGERDLAERAWISLGGLLVEFRQVDAEAEAGDREERLRRLTTSLGMGSALVPRLGLEPLLQRLLGSARELARAERGFVLLSSGDGDFEVAATDGLEVDDLRAREFSGSSSTIQEVLDSGRTVVASDARDESHLAERASVVAGGIRALACLPLIASDRVLGALYLDSRSPGAIFEELDVELLEAVASQAALALAVDGLRSELRGLARKLPQRGDLPRETAERLAGELERVADLATSRRRSAEALSWSAIRDLHPVSAEAGS